MDILKFLNSATVAKHLKNIDYKFSAQEAAFVVWNSAKPLEDKLAAWTEIIEAMPDCAVRCRFDHVQYPSLRQFLKNYMELISRVGDNADEGTLSDEDCELYTAFEYMWFNIPTPFKKGDIVYSKSVHIKCLDKYVLFDMNNWSKSDFIANGYTDKEYNLDKIDTALKARATSGDYTDMSAHGYRIVANGDIEEDFFCNYIDFEYFDADKLDGDERVLKPLSAYLKGNIDLELFLNSYKIIIEEERIAREKIALDINDDGLRLAGLKR